MSPKSFFICLVSGLAPVVGPANLESRYRVLGTKARSLKLSPALAGLQASRNFPEALGLEGAATRIPYT